MSSNEIRAILRMLTFILLCILSDIFFGFFPTLTLVTFSFLWFFSMKMEKYIEELLQEIVRLKNRLGKDEVAINKNFKEVKTTLKGHQNELKSLSDVEKRVKNWLYENKKEIYRRALKKPD